MEKKGVWSIVFFLFLLCLPWAFVSAQKTDGGKITMEFKDEQLSSIFKRLEKISAYKVLFAYEDVSIYKATGKVKSATIEQVMKVIIGDKPLKYHIEGQSVNITLKKRGEIASIRGTVFDASSGEPLTGATVRNVRNNTGTTTDMDGVFTLSSDGEPSRLLISYIGKKSIEVRAVPGKTLRITLEEDHTAIEEVVVTGIYTRKKESFTGSSQTYKGEELKNVGTQNLVQSLKTLDPAFAVIENNQFGSDPNKLPDLEIRGKSSIVGLKEQFGEDPNQPLFILDGFETTLQVIMDLSMDRVASVTILKDAASTAIYGAKAANGVVVVETKTPQSGKLRLSYNGSFDISFADLTDYNLMNAAEKLEFERLAGNFESNLADYQELKQMRYNMLLANVQRGVDTYWMSEPLRTGLNQRHNIFVEGGNEQFRYGLGATYNKVEGVMKASGRENMSGNIDLLYRVGKLSFSNKLSVDVVKHGNPVVSFSDYALANPYYPKRNPDGSVEKWLEQPEQENSASSALIYVPNPLWNDALNSYDKGESFSVRDNFNLEYRPFPFLYVRGRFGLSKSTSDAEKFLSPEDTSFDEVELLKKGSYEDERSDVFSYDGDLTVTYGQLLSDAHQINAVFGASIRESKSITKGFVATGFPEGNFTTPGFANSYPESGKPSYGDYKTRSANFYFNGGYSYKDRYLLDANLRMDGTSVFGSNKRFTTTWAVGLAWNVHNEKFIKDHTSAFTMFKLRTSIGNPGNQNFGSYNTLTTYRYNNWLLNNFGTGLLFDAIGDPNLEWQKTIDFNAGFDLSVRDRFHINFDWFHKNTSPLLATIGIPLSVGVSNRLANIGKQVAKGVNGTVRYAIIYRPKERINWTASLSFRHVTSYYDNIGSKLDSYNRENLTKNLVRYYDGGSPTALWAVRSAGIDPATGQEIFLTKSGKPVFSHSFEDEVVVGDSTPDVEGVFGNTFYWKGFSCSIYLRYSLGAEAFNSTLYDKVENISASGLSSNQDKRALYDRWIKPGDVACYKGISITDSTPMSSRFVQKANFLSIESVRLAYELPQSWMKKIGFSGMTLGAYMNEICRFSVIEEERGINYPFARSVSLALSLNF